MRRQEGGDTRDAQQADGSGDEERLGDEHVHEQDAQVGKSTPASLFGSLGVIHLLVCPDVKDIALIRHFLFEEINALERGLPLKKHVDDDIEIDLIHFSTFASDNREDLDQGGLLLPTLPLPPSIHGEGRCAHTHAPGITTDFSPSP